MLQKTTGTQLLSNLLGGNIIFRLSYRGYTRPGWQSSTDGRHAALLQWRRQRRRLLPSVLLGMGYRWGRLGAVVGLSLLATWRLPCIGYVGFGWGLHSFHFLGVPEYTTVVYNLSLSLYIYIYMCVYIYIYIYIHMFPICSRHDLLLSYTCSYAHIEIIVAFSVAQIFSVLIIAS